MKFFILFLFFQTLLFSSLELSSQEKSYLNSKKNITMCVDPEWMPFEKIEHSKHIGMAADYLQIISKKINTPILLLETTNWSESIQKAKSRECDIFSLASETKIRKIYMNFTKSYLDLPLVLATKLDKSFLSSLNIINGKTVAVVKGYAIIEILKKEYPKIKIKYVNSINEGLKKVESGEVYGYLDNLIVLSYYIQKHFTGNIKISARLNDDLKLSIGTRNDEPELKNIFNKAIQDITHEQKQAIFDKWVKIKYEKNHDYLSLIINIAIISLLILIFLIYRNKNLGIYNKKLQVINDKLVVAKAKAEDANRHKSEFFANVSHELRTPLNGILGMIYLIQQDKLSQEQKKYALKAEESSQALLRIITDILDISKLEACKLKLEYDNFSLIKMINLVILNSSTLAEEKAIILNVTYTKDYQKNLYGDSLRLEQVLNNLVTNAIKFTNKGSVEIVVKNISKNIYRFEVNDSGIGISQATKDKLFKPFSQADGTITRKYGGTGLGLAISKEIITLMDGKIWLESQLGVGSSFIFEVELKNAKETPEETSISCKTLSSEDKQTTDNDKKDISSEDISNLFKELLAAAKKMRPILCEPILNELLSCKLNHKQSQQLKDVESEIKKYRFKEAVKIMEKDYE